MSAQLLPQVHRNHEMSPSQVFGSYKICISTRQMRRSIGTRSAERMPAGKRGLPNSKQWCHRVNKCASCSEAMVRIRDDTVTWRAWRAAKNKDRVFCFNNLTLDAVTTFTIKRRVKTFHRECQCAAAPHLIQWLNEDCAVSAEWVQRESHSFFYSSYELQHAFSYHHPLSTGLKKITQPCRREGTR